MRACSIKKITELTNSKSKSNFKNDFLKLQPQKVKSALEKHKFNIKLLWSREADGAFETIKNDSHKIKK